MKPILIKRNWLVIAALSMVVAILWIGITVYKILNTSTIPEPRLDRIQLFSTKLDEAVLPELESRRKSNSEQFDESKRIILLSEQDQQEEQPLTISTSGGALSISQTPLAKELTPTTSP